MNLLFNVDLINKAPTAIVWEKGCNMKTNTVSYEEAKRYFDSVYSAYTEAKNKYGANSAPADALLSRLWCIVDMIHALWGVSLEYDM